LHVRRERAGVNAVLAGLRRSCEAFIGSSGRDAVSTAIDHAVEARYAGQVWEIEVPLTVTAFADDGQLASLAEAFHAMHERIFAIRDPGSVIEFVGWTATARCRLHAAEAGRLRPGAGHGAGATRRIYIAGLGEVDAVVHDFEAMENGREHVGPAIVESPFTTVVADSATRFARAASGSLVMRP
jgi:N-methylhydantoinase A